MSGRDNERSRPSLLSRSGSLLILLLMLLYGAGYAQRINAQWSHPPVESRGGMLFRTGPEAEPVPAPLQATEVAIRVSGMLARVRVVQHFLNPSDAWVEGVYVFPLPDTAAVDHLRMQLDDRIIEGQVREREEARRSYVQAAASGQRATLVEQERPNIFTASVANIAPGSTVTVELEYQQTVEYEAGGFSLRFPMVVGPRYIPGVPVGPAGTGWAVPTTAVDDADRITPPVRLPSQGPVNPVQLSVELAPGFEAAAVESAYHPVTVESPEANHYRVRLAKGAVPADRDFLLRWRPVGGALPRTALFSESDDAGGGYGLVQLIPSVGDEAPLPAPREVIFVIDVSGSMHGESIAQARAALLLALGRLGPDDRFNIIRFNDAATALFPAAHRPDGWGMAQARQLIAGLRAEGGTEMLTALQLALAHGHSDGRVRQVVFLTDGAVGDEDRLFEYIRQNAGSSRLFTVGIGSAPNSHFMRKAAAFGRGTFTHVGSPDEVGERMGELLRKLEAPQLTHLELETVASEAGVELLPERIPDLYQGEPLVLALRWHGAAPQVRLRGELAGQPWSQALDLSKARAGAGVNVLWARRRIDALMDQHRAAADDNERAQLRAAVVETALHHHLVSPFTSLVAVDVTPVRPGAEPLHTRAVETNLPHGWDYGHVFGMPQTATAAPLLRLLGVALLALALLFWRFRPGVARW